VFCPSGNVRKLLALEVILGRRDLLQQRRRRAMRNKQAARETLPAWTRFQLPESDAEGSPTSAPSKQKNTRRFPAGCSSK
jgi:hypothetical protein